MGYHRAGFEVVGVDIVAQPRYPFDFLQGDALEIVAALGSRFSVIHASPPCQAHSTITPDKSKHVDLIPATRAALIATGKPYVIENVEGAKRELVDPMLICGSSLGMRVRRHRWFESNVYLTSLPCAHGQQGVPVGVYGQHADTFEGRPDGTSRGVKARDDNEAREVMGMDWATWHGATQAVPPAYTEFIGRQIMRELVAA
jgi:DNA (cytosine-5)-methyltransferase 1